MPKRREDGGGDIGLLLFVLVIVGLVLLTATVYAAPIALALGILVYGRRAPKASQSFKLEPKEIEALTKVERELWIVRTRLSEISEEGSHLKLFQNLLKDVDEDDNILIMKQHDRNRSYDNKFVVSAARTRYSKLLIDKVKKEGIPYHRIICIAPPLNEADFKLEFLRPWLREHLREMAKLRKTHSDKISLRKAPIRIGADIFVVPKKIGVVILDFYGPETDIRSAMASIVFHYRPNDKIIDQLHDWFTEVSNGSYPIEDSYLNSSASVA